LIGGEQSGSRERLLETNPGPGRFPEWNMGEIKETGAHYLRLGCGRGFDNSRLPLKLPESSTTERR